MPADRPAERPRFLSFPIFAGVALLSGATVVGARPLAAQRASASPARPSRARQHATAAARAARRTTFPVDTGTFRNGAQVLRVAPEPPGTTQLDLTTVDGPLRLTAPSPAVRAAARRTRAVADAQGCRSSNGLWETDAAPDVGAVVAATHGAAVLTLNCAPDDDPSRGGRVVGTVLVEAQDGAVRRKLRLPVSEFRRLLATLEAVR